MRECHQGLRGKIVLIIACNTVFYRVETCGPTVFPSRPTGSDVGHALHAPHPAAARFAFLPCVTEYDPTNFLYQATVQLWTDP